MNKISSLNDINGKTSSFPPLTDVRKVRLREFKLFTNDHKNGGSGIQNQEVKIQTQVQSSFLLNHKFLVPNQSHQYLRKFFSGTAPFFPP